MLLTVQLGRDCATRERMLPASRYIALDMPLTQLLEPRIGNRGVAP